MPEDAPQKHVTNSHFYDRISDAYDAISDANEHTAREAGERLLCVAAGEHVLEIGLGTGNSILHFAKVVGSDGKTCGLDVSEGMLRVAQAKVEYNGLGKSVELRIGVPRKTWWHPAILLPRRGVVVEQCQAATSTARAVRASSVRNHKDLPAQTVL